MIKAVLFDMDGVLVDSEDLSIEIGIKFFKEKGYEIKKENFLNHLGTGMSDFVLGAAGEIGASVSVKEADDFYKNVYESEAGRKNIAMPYAKDVVTAFKNAGIKIAVCSSAQEWKVNANIKAIGLEPSFFDLVVNESFIKRNKSFPDIYLLSAALLGVDRNDAIIIEDSPGGVKAGLNASIRTVALTTTMKKEEAENSGCDRVIKNIAELKDIKTAKELEDYLFSSREEDALYGANYIKASKGDIRPEVINNCIRMALKAREAAYAPYSNYKVGAAVLSAKSGKIYTGSNIENSSFGGTICAERNAITTALTSENGLIGVDLLVVASSDWPPAPPCALCLQVLSEFSKEDTKVILVDLEGHREDFLFKDLLPHPFIFPTSRK